MADTARLQTYLNSQPAYRTAWNQLQRDVLLGDQQSRTEARQAFAYSVRKLLQGKVDHPEHYVADPTSGQLLYQPDHSLRNSLLVLGGVAALPGGSSLAGLGGAGAVGATTGGGSALAADVGLETAAGLTGGTAGAAGTTAGLGMGARLGLQYGLPLAGNVVGSLIQSRASGKAAEIQDQYLREALAYEKERDAYDRRTNEERYAYDRDLEASRYGDREGRLSPYRATGGSANAQMAALLGLPAPAPYTPTAPPSLPRPVVTTPGAPIPTTATAPATIPMVALRAPDGTVKQVPESEVQHYLDRGAVRA